MIRQADYFDSGDEQIFSLHYPPLQDKDVSEGVVICPPAPFEVLRSQRALRNLAQNLAKKGYHVLRLDYRGTGDSSGDYRNWSLENWQSDILASVTRLRDVYGVQRVSVVGLRLGAALAWKALQGKSIKRFVMWDPIFDGSEYFQQLTDTHKHLVEREPDRAPFARDDSRPQLLGFALSPTWISELKDFRLELPAVARGVIVQSHDQALDTPIGNMKRVLVEGDDQRWSSSGLLHIQSFAHSCVAAVEQALEGRS
ncbi:MAG: alpha/beta fold hydrolase [Proteobacteria bacterium]|nr:MAG: alpha/beta fold hydrolase [Pseudomonadota bacterium]